MIRIAQIRCVPKIGDVPHNLILLGSVLADIQDEKVDVVVTPECFLDGYAATEPEVDSQNLAQMALDYSNLEEINSLREWCQKKRAFLILGLSLKDAGEIYNSTLVINREGKISGRYDKTHLLTHDLKYDKGSSLPVFDSDFGKFGVLICADRRWPETVRTLAEKGTRIIFNPTFGRNDDLNLGLMRTRSFESEVFIAFTHPERSLLTGPKGQVILNEESPSSRFSICEIELSQADEARDRENAHLKNRRADLY